MDLSSRVIGRKYRLEQKIGSGSFGVVYSAVDVTSGQEVAVKLEPTTSRHQLSSYEAKVLRQLRGGEGIPQVLWFGSEEDYNCMVIQKLGPSLEDILHSCNHLLSLKTTIMLALQILVRIEYIHNQSFLHRDIKPDNFLIDAQNLTLVYAIDFGLAKKYRDPTSHQHIPYRENKSLTGTARYVSIMTHMGIEQSRRDDIESIGYMLVYFLKGSLPWQGVVGDNKQEKYNKIMDLKVSTKLDVLCRGLPAEFAVFLQYARSLKFEEKPDYRYLMNVFLNLASRESIQIDDHYDWHIPKASASLLNLSLVPPVTKKRRSRRRKSAQPSASSNVVNSSNMASNSSQFCRAASDMTDENVSRPSVKDRQVLELRRKNLESQKECCIA
jgi:serine/threonine protein kinase